MPEYRIVVMDEEIRQSIFHVASQIAEGAHEIHLATGKEEACTLTNLAVIAAISEIMEAQRLSFFSETKEDKAKFQTALRKGIARARAFFKNPTEKEMDQILDLLKKR